MALLEILEYPHPILATPAEPIAVVDDVVRKLADDMAETMYDAPGVGLAANQVGVLMRIFVVDCAAEDEPSQLYTFINPELLEVTGTQTWNEGCLSFPGAVADIQRAERVHVRALDRQGNPFELTAEGLLAVAIQHETDHLNGVLMIDKVGPLKRRKIAAQVREAQSERD
jgi:peptide deformylase